MVSCKVMGQGMVSQVVSDVEWLIILNTPQEDDSDMEEGEGLPNEEEWPVSEESSEEELEEVCTDQDTVRV